MRLHDGAPPEKLAGVRISHEGSEQHLRRLDVSLQRIADAEFIRMMTAEDPITTTTQETLPGEQND